MQASIVMPMMIVPSSLSSFSSLAMTGGGGAGLPSGRNITFGERTINSRKKSLITRPIYLKRLGMAGCSCLPCFVS